MNIIIFEDNKTELLKPLSINHASCEVRVGAFTNLERFNLISKDITLIVRDEIKDIIKEKYPNYHVNPDYVLPGICINGSLVINDDLFTLLNNDDFSYSHESTLISFHCESENISIKDFKNRIIASSLVTKDIKVDRVEYLWDCIDFSQEYLIKDTRLIQFSNEFDLDSSSILISMENVYFGKNSKIKAGAILDADNGPIIIDEGAVIGNGVILEGPIYIGKNSIISSGALLKNNVCIGPSCKVGGELTSIIFQGYSNKVHDGFMGNSYIGEWVNIGAGTNNSNLKNNYSSIKFNIGNDLINTEKLFLGVMVGDYSRLGIMTMINSGTYIGLGANVFGKGFQPKFINDFSWGIKEKVDFDKFINTIKKMKSRRNKNISDIEFNFLKKKYLI